MGADSSIDTITNIYIHVYILPVTSANSLSHRLSHCNLSHYGQWAVLQIPKKPKNLFNLPKRYNKVFFFSNISNTLFNQKSPVHREPGFPGGDKQTNMETLRLNQHRKKISEKVTHIIKKV